MSRVHSISSFEQTRVMAERMVPNSGDPRVAAAFARIRSKFPDLEHAMIMHAHLEKRSSERLNEHNELIDNHVEVLKSSVELAKVHADLLRSHEEHLKRNEEADKRHKAAKLEHEEWLKHITDKLDALTDIVMRREGGSEARA